MNILITAGGTSEKIDDVRYITNHSTGGLGKKIAESFAQDPTTTITYLHGKEALLPQGDNITFSSITSVNDLLQQMTSLLSTQTFTAVIHSMAVSDYQLNSVSDQTDLSQKLAALLQQNPALDLSDGEALAQAIDSHLSDLLAPKEQVEKKISSKSANLILALGASAKVIHIIKKLQPETILVGFKLLVDVTEEHLLAVAYETLVKNQGDFVLANDLHDVGPVNHRGLLIDSKQNVEIFTTKGEIAEGIKEAITRKLKGATQ